MISPLRRTAALVAAALLVTSCSGDTQAPPPSSAPAPSTTASTTPDPAALAKFTGQRLNWGPCGPFAQDDTTKKLFADKTLDCAKLTVPLNYLKPGDDTVTLGLLRHKATKTAERIGSLVTDPGGPGGSGMTEAASLAKAPSAARLLQRFDLVGFDPRGVGASEPRVTCRTDAEQDADRASDSESDTSPAGVTKQLADAVEYSSKCVDNTPHGAAFLANIGTRDVVRDLDVLRAALGDKKLTYLGFSYGTQIGTAYAEAYPANVRAMVLDGAVDPEQDIATSLITQMGGFQDAFTEFGQWCAPRADCALGRDAAGVTAAFQKLARPLITKPVTVGRRALSFEDTVTGTSAALYSRNAWPFLNAGLAQLKRGQGNNLLALADSYYGRDQTGHYHGEIDVYFAVRCVDYARITDRAAIDTAHARMLQAAPYLVGGTPDTSELDICSSWPVRPTSQAHLPHISGLPKTLVISTTHDPATPYQQGVNLARDIKGALLTFDGAQHTIFLEGNACVDKAGTDYLVDGTVPADGARCS